MGLELVEIILEVEQHFGVEISDEEAYQLRTPRLLMRCVEEKVNLAPKSTEPCATQVAFYKIRKILVTQFKQTKRNIRPSSPLQTMLPSSNPNYFLKKLLSTAGVNNGPHLDFTDTFQRIVIYPFTLIFLVTFIQIAYSFGFYAGLVGAFLLSWLPIQVIFALSGHKRNCLYPHNYTLGDLSHNLVATNHNAVRKTEQLWTKALIEQDVRVIIMDILTIGHFDKDADFIDDLGAG